MKLRLRIRHNMFPSEHTIGWKNHEPVVRLYEAEVALAKKLGISPAKYAEQLLNAHYRRSANA